MSEACQVVVSTGDEVVECGEVAEAVEMVDGGVIWACAEHRELVPAAGRAEEEA